MDWFWLSHSFLSSSESAIIKYSRRFYEITIFLKSQNVIFGKWIAKEIRGTEIDRDQGRHEAIDPTDTERIPEIVIQDREIHPEIVITFVQEMIQETVIQELQEIIREIVIQEFQEIAQETDILGIQEIFQEIVTQDNLERDHERDLETDPETDLGIAQVMNQQAPFQKKQTQCHHISQSKKWTRKLKCRQ